MSQSFGQSNDGCEYKKSFPYYYKDVAVKKWFKHWYLYDSFLILHAQLLIIIGYVG